MDINGSNLDRELDSYIRETTVDLSPTVEQPSGTSPYDQHTPDSADSSLTERYGINHADHETYESEDDFQVYERTQVIRMGGSRPPSRTTSSHLRSRATSTCSSFLAGEEEPHTHGYLFLNEVPPLRIKKNTTTRYPPVHPIKQKQKGQTHSRTACHDRRNHSQNSTVRQDTQSRSCNQIKTDNHPAEQILKTPLDVIKSPQHAWYFIRRLVGLELRWEAARAWKLTDLNLTSADRDSYPSCNHSSDQSDDDKSVYSWDSSSDETTIAAENLPILRYLIQNFLLTLPIIRDGASILPSVINNITKPNPQVTMIGNSASVYWTAGVLPVLRRLHQSNLSAAIDLGSPGFFHIILDLHIGRLVERFIATSLKLSEKRLNVASYPHQSTDQVISKTAGSLSQPHSGAPLTNNRDLIKFSMDAVSHKELINEPQLSDNESFPQQDMKPLESLKSNNRQIPYLKEVAFVTKSGRQDSSQARRYIQKFEKEPVRYSGVSVQPSQRASIELVTPSTLNSVLDPNEDYPSYHKGNYSTDFPSHQMHKPITTPSSRLSSAVLSSSSTYDQRQTDTEISILTPTVSGSFQASLVTPIDEPTSFNSQQIHVGPTNSRKSVVSSFVTPEDGESVRQTIERLKLMRHKPGELDQVDNKLNVPARPSRRFSWIRPTGTKVFPTSKTDGKENIEVRSSFDSRQNAPVLADMQVPYTSSNHLDVEEKGLYHMDSKNQVVTHTNSSKISRQDFIDDDMFVGNHQTSRNLDEVGADGDTEEKQYSRRGLVSKPLSLRTRVGVAENLQQEMKGYRGFSNLKSEDEASSFSPPSPNTLYLNRSRTSPPRDAVPPLENVTVRDSLVEGLLSPYKSVYPPENLKVRFETFEILKESIPWPWGDPVPFWKGASVHKLSWGGFEVDLVGLRRKNAVNSYIIRVRRPSRLDEFVLRKESHFNKYFSRLSKDFPNAHIRKIPGYEVNLEDEMFSLDSLLREDEKRPIPHREWSSLASEGASRALLDHRIEPSQIHTGPFSSSNPQFLDPFSNMPLKQWSAPVSEGPKRKNTLASLFGVGNHKSKFSVDTRSDWNEPNRLRDKFPMIQNERVKFDREVVGSSRKLSHREQLVRDSSDSHRRALRSWLRDTLSIRTVGHHPETAAFLLLRSVIPEEKDLLDIRHREKIDDERRKKRIQVAQGAAERAQSIHGWWNAVKEEFINGDGVQNLSTALKKGKTIDELPLRFQKALEWIRMNISELLHELFVTGNQSDILFGKFLGLNAAIPWTLLKNVLKINRPNVMCKALLEVFLSKKLNLGKTKQNVIQRLIEIAINETEGDPIEVERRIQACRARIQSLTMCEKIIKFVHASKGLKNLFRQYSESEDIELVVAIVRSAEEPRLDRYDLERVMRASKVYKSLLKKHRNRITSSMTASIHVRLILDLKLYLRLISQEWDSRQIRKMFCEDRIIEAVEILISPILEFFKRTYKIGNAVRAVQDAQNFIEQLISVVNALRSRIQDPQKSVRILSRLLARHQSNLYDWLHMIHAHDSIIDEFFQWLSRAMEFLKQGGCQPVLISDIMPQGDLSSLDLELEDVIQWEEAKRQRQYEYLCRRYSADVDGDDPVIVEGDGFGKSKVESLIDLQPLPPQLDHIASCLEMFRRAVRRTYT